MSARAIFEPQPDAPCRGKPENDSSHDWVSVGMAHIDADSMGDRFPNPLGTAGVSGTAGHPFVYLYACALCAVQHASETPSCTARPGGTTLLPRGSFSFRDGS